VFVKKLEQQNFHVCVLKKMCTDKNLHVRGSAQTKHLCKKAEIFVFGIFLYHQNYEEKKKRYKRLK